MQLIQVKEKDTNTIVTLEYNQHNVDVVNSHLQFPEFVQSLDYLIIIEQIGEDIFKKVLTIVKNGTLV